MITQQPHPESALSGDDVRYIVYNMLHLLLHDLSVMDCRIARCCCYHSKTVITVFIYSDLHI